MYELEINDEETLRKELRAAREKIDQLVGDLRGVDRELEELSGEQEQYTLLRSVCTSLDQLEELGGGDLFWDAQDAGGGAADRLRLVRARVDEFEKRIGGIEDRRQSLLDEIQVHEDGADLIAGDVLEAERLEELKKREWIIEREDAEITIHDAIMPWARGGEDDQRFRKALAISMLLSLVFGLLLPLVDVPLPDRWKVLEEQDRLTRLIREELPPPPVVVEQPPPVREEEPIPSEETPIVAEQKALEPSPGPDAKKKDPAAKGILAFREKFSSLATNKATDRLGANARIKTQGGESGPPERSLVTTQAAGSSGGINIASLSRDIGDGSGREMGGVAVVQATSSIGTGGGGSDRPLSGGPALSRTDEEIQIVFDRHKAALYRLYNRELRRNPTLKGQIVLRMTIEPDGSVSMCELKSTNMKSKTLSSQVIERVKTFDFGAKEGIPAITIVYPIDFLPAA